MVNVCIAFLILLVREWSAHSFMLTVSFLSFLTDLTKLCLLSEDKSICGDQALMDRRGSLLLYLSETQVPSTIRKVMNITGK